MRKALVYGYSKKQKGFENGLHIETPLGIINIFAGLQDRFGREAMNVVILPDEKTKLTGSKNNIIVKLKK